MVKIAISDKVYISGLTSEQKYELAKMLTIPNPAYHKAIARGQRWTKLPPAFKYLEHTGFDSYLCAVPIGCLRDVIKLVGEHTIDDRRVGVKRDTSYSKIKLRDYQEKIIEDIGKKEIGIIHAGVGVGKCHEKGTGIIMFDGKVKKVEDIQEGDLVMGVDNKPRTVQGIGRGHGELFRITPVKGNSFVVNGGHMLSLNATTCHGYKAGDITNISVYDYISSVKDFKKTHKLWRAHFELPRRGTVLEPYFLGVWLGDGTSNNCNITSPDKEIKQYLGEYANRLGKTCKSRSYGGKCEIHTITDDIRKCHQTNWSITKHLRLAGLKNNKHIPDEYLYNSRENRLQLLAGLVDTDGSVGASNTMEFSNTNKILIDQVAYLARSLGFHAHVAERTTRIKSLNYTCKSWRINMSGDLDLVPTKIKRKQCTPRKQKKRHYVTGIKRIESVGHGDFFGFELDGDHLYMTEDFIVHHNTILGLHLASQVVANGGKVCITTIRTNLVEQFAIECERFLGIKPNIVPAKRKADKNPDSPITIASVSTLQSMKEEHRHLFKSDMFIIDEAHAMMTEKREKLIMSIKSKYRYAMTGTLNNEYGKSDVLGWIFGGVVAEYKMTMIKPTVKVVSTGFRFHSEDYHEIAAELAECGERNKLIVKAVQNTEHNRAIILVKRVEHAKALQASLSEVGISSVQLDGKSSQEEREEALRGSGSKSAIIGSFGLLGTGINVPELDLLVLAGDIKSKNLSLQSCGRVLRLHEGKTGATVIDMWDEFSGILRTHGLNRMRSYREMDWKVSKLKL